MENSVQKMSGGGVFWSSKIYDNDDSVINTDTDKKDIADKIRELVTKYKVTFNSENNKEQYFFQCYLINTCTALGLNHNENNDKDNDKDKATRYLNTLISKINDDKDLKIAKNIKRLLIKAKLVNEEESNISTVEAMGGKKRRTKRSKAPTSKRTRGKKYAKKSTKKTAKKMRS